mmetsp:Transcript_55410/g.63950  ORF Transcript_55410/g.63950 Transcript_55410/m.63950 type:complete len:147 (-) Transcript_55410:238-678(-)
MRHFCAHILVLVLVLASLSVSWGATTKAEDTFVPITTEPPTDEATVADTESPTTPPENPSDVLPAVNTTETVAPTPPLIYVAVVPTTVAPPEEQTEAPTANVTTNATSNTTNTTDDEDSGAFSSMSGGRVVAVAVGLMTAVVVTVF